MKQLGWTSIEQSKKLIEAGLRLDTSDMYYLIIANDEYSDSPNVGNEKHEFPCWNLGALIELLPKTIEIKKPRNLYFLEIYPASNGIVYSAFNDKKEMIFLKAFTSGNGGSDTLIGNVVNMIVWLLDNNYIKK